MSPLVLIMVAVAGGAGAALRFLVDTAVQRRSADRTAFPWGTAVINVTGSLLLGLVTGAVTGLAADPAWPSVVGIGLLGGYTTFSTASVETARLLLRRRYGLGLLNGVGIGLLCVAAAYLGLIIGATVIMGWS